MKLNGHITDASGVQAGALSQTFRGLHLRTHPDADKAASQVIYPTQNNTGSDFVVRALNNGTTLVFRTRTGSSTVTNATVSTGTIQFNFSYRASA